MSTSEDLMTDAIEELATDDDYNRHEAHDERRDTEGCWICREEADEATAEHAWMGRAVKTWPNPYAPSDPQAPERDWYLDDSGYVRADA